MNDVLEEARQILTGGKEMDDDEEVLAESTTVEIIQPSPKRLSQPIEIVVRHSKIVSEQNTDDEDDDDENFREAPEGLHSSDFTGWEKVDQLEREIWFSDTLIIGNSW